MIVDAAIYGADSIMFDLEDAISPSEKDSARMLVYHALLALPKKDCELVVRINGLDSIHGEEDIKYMVAAGVDVIRLPKTETALDIKAVEAIIEKAEIANNRVIGSTKMMAAIESPLGVIHAYEIAKASSRLVGIALGAEDYVTNLKTKRSAQGLELLHARSQILTAARACGIAALDTVYSDLDNMDGFKDEVILIHQLGFDGKSVINPRQIDIVHDIYKPSEEEVAHALEVKTAAIKAEREGQGVFTVNGKMVDRPIIDRALRVLQLAGVNEVI
jgi:citrate lyase subunit beta/citryl-CoA lyase